LRRQARKLLGVSLGRSVLDQDVLALDITEFTQPLAECLGKVRTRLGFSRQITDTGNLLLRLGGERRGEEAARDRSHEPPSSKRIAERFASDRAGHRPPMENAGVAGSLAEADGTHFWKVDAQLSPRGVRCKSTSPIDRQRRLELVLPAALASGSLLAGERE